MNNGNGSKKQPGLIHPLTAEERTQLEHALDARHPEIGIAARLMGRLGLRVAEVQGLTWAQMHLDDWPNPTLTITAATTKTGYARELPIPQTLYEILVQHRYRKRNEWTNRVLEKSDPSDSPGFLASPVISHPNGKQLTIRWYQKAITTTGRATLNRRVHPHTLRHTFATRLLAETNIRVVQAALGHRSIRSTQIYTHPSMNDLRTAIDKAGGQE